MDCHAIITDITERKLQTLRTWWSQLTDEDWIRIAGQRDILQVVIQEKYGYTQDLARQDVERCFLALTKIR